MPKNKNRSIQWCWEGLINKAKKLFISFFLMQENMTKGCFDWVRELNCCLDGNFICFLVVLFSTKLTKKREIQRTIWKIRCPKKMQRVKRYNWNFCFALLILFQKKNEVSWIFHEEKPSVVRTWTKLRAKVDKINKEK